MSRGAGQRTRVARVRSRAGLERFIEAGYRLRAHDTYWVPPPRRDLRTLLDRNRHPFHQHAQVDYFLAFRDGKLAGRIAAIENHAHNRFHGEKIAFFGFFDLALQADEEVVAALLRRVEAWARERGLDEVRGPCSFSTNEECGLLVDGFDAPPMLMMPWNPSTWPALIEQAGYEKAKDLYSWWVDEHLLGDRIARLAGRIRDKLHRRQESVISRPLNMKNFREELERVRTIYNTAWEKNWGFVPMTRAEIDHMAKELKPLVVPEIVRFVEVNGEPAGFSVALPDYNTILQHLEGKLGPKEIALFLLLRNRIRSLRMLTMGVIGKFRNRGLETLLINDTINEGLRLGYRGAELGWVLEDNHLLNRTLKAMGARHYKTHRLYRKAV